jgi:hypothetical protein
MSYNNIYGHGESNYLNVGADSGSGSFSMDPMFVAGYSLSKLSLCVDAGDPNPIYNDADGSRADMGAIPSADWIYPVTSSTSFGPDTGEIYVSTLTPDIYWSYLDTAATTQQQYEIEVGSDSDWSVAEMWATGSVTAPDTHVVYAGDPLSSGNNIYYLRIRLGNESTWGDWKSDLFILDFDSDMCGDANGDETVNIFDVTSLISHLYLEGTPPDPLESADVNSDSSVNIFDITSLISFLYLGGPEPDCP